MSARALIPPRTALLLMDFYEGTVGRLPTAVGEQVLQAAISARRVARARGVRVIYVVPNYRPGYPEIANRKPESIRDLMASKRFTTIDPAVAIHPRLAAEDGDFVVRKFRYSSFWNTDLELLLRAQGIDTLVLAGIATSGCVLSTLRDADDRAFDVHVLSDACADFDEEVQRVLMDKLFPIQAQLIRSDAFAAALSR